MVGDLWWVTYDWFKTLHIFILFLKVCPHASSPNFHASNLSIFLLPGLRLTSQAISYCLWVLYTYCLWVPGLLLTSHKVDVHVENPKFCPLERFFLTILSLELKETYWSTVDNDIGARTCAAYLYPLAPLYHLHLTRLLLGLPNLMILWATYPSSVLDIWTLPRLDACLNQGPEAPKELFFKWYIIFQYR